MKNFGLRFCLPASTARPRATRPLEDYSPNFGRPAQLFDHATFAVYKPWSIGVGGTAGAMIFGAVHAAWRAALLGAQCRRPYATQAPTKFVHRRSLPLRARAAITRASFQVN